MTREDAGQLKYRYSEYGLCDGKAILIEDMEEILDIVFTAHNKELLELNDTTNDLYTEISKNRVDDFESRTCNSCKWGIYVYNKDILLCGAAVCLGLDEYWQYVVTKDFGCNKYEANQ